jgi:hypothetical protein
VKQFFGSVVEGIPRRSGGKWHGELSDDRGPELPSYNVYPAEIERVRLIGEQPSIPWLTAIADITMVSRA